MSILNTVTQIIPVTDFQRKKNNLYNNLYWPIMQRIIPPSNMPKANVRFKDAAACRAEAWAMAHLHAALLPQFGTLTIVQDLENDPWSNWRLGSNNVDGKQRARAAGFYIVDTKTGAVYDHRNRYCIPEPWAYQLGFVNPFWTWARIGAPERNPYAEYGATGIGASLYDKTGKLKTPPGRQGYAV